ncbi:hypothetical protein FIBSPDRAFT_948945 [Athelia psychrophila]|uniref:Uncharacterized protein n=1 Tax=Athelia psychrophila TaxID=1759441 RepID=A0A166QBU3_9AGAM|nr:hypothetical protein FIBSPDRAFT_948945 [Fibularhizoctonia sp. CBS 109695]
MISRHKPASYKKKATKENTNSPAAKRVQRTDTTVKEKVMKVTQASQVAKKWVMKETSVGSTHTSTRVQKPSQRAANALDTTEKTSNNDSKDDDGDDLPVSMHGSTSAGPSNDNLSAIPSMPHPLPKKPGEWTSEARDALSQVVMSAEHTKMLNHWLTFEKLLYLQDTRRIKLAKAGWPRQITNWID